MRPYLVMKLEGPMQAWGGHTFEDNRPSELFPTRSGLLGLLAACLGVKREDSAGLQALADSVLFTVRVDCPPLKMTDYHTVKDARREYRGLKSVETIQTWREYLLDAKYTVAIAAAEQATVSLEDLKKALCKPVFTPFLGRRSCPLSRPLFFKWAEAENALAALAGIEAGAVKTDSQHPPQSPDRWTLYTEEPASQAATLRLRDMPIPDRRRQFGVRAVRIVHQENGHVPQ